MPDLASIGRVVFTTMFYQVDGRIGSTPPDVLMEEWLHTDTFTGKDEHGDDFMVRTSINHRGDIAVTSAKVTSKQAQQFMITD